jgi:ADP-heptose:LPS heptosyltransferase
MPISEKGEDGANALLKEKGVGLSERFIAMNPGASCASKKWPAKRFAELGKALAEKYRTKIVLVADDSDKRFADEIESIIKGPCVNLSGRTTISELASVLKRARLFISNDSGPVHIACAVGTPVVAIFGRNDAGLSPKRWAPSGEGSVFLHKDVGCDMCLAHNCKIGFKCLEAITVDEVLKVSEKMLS